MPDLGDPRIHLRTGELSAFAGLGALGHLDLDLFGVHEVLARDAEAPGRDLLDGASAPVAIRIAAIPTRVFAAFTGVRLRAQAIHRDRERGVRFLADRAVRHRARREPRVDL